jgi:hypothetical protein
VLGFLCHFSGYQGASLFEARFSGKEHTPPRFRSTDDDRARSAIPACGKNARVLQDAHLRELDGLHRQLAEAFFYEQTKGAFARGYRKWILVNTLSFDRKTEAPFLSKIERLFRTPGKISLSSCRVIPTRTIA